MVVKHVFITVPWAQESSSSVKQQHFKYSTVSSPNFFSWITWIPYSSLIIPVFLQVIAPKLQMCYTPMLLLNLHTFTFCYIWRTDYFLFWHRTLELDKNCKLHNCPRAHWELCPVTSQLGLGIKLQYLRQSIITCHILKIGINCMLSCLIWYSLVRMIILLILHFILLYKSSCTAAFCQDKIKHWWIWQVWLIVLKDLKSILNLCML